MVFFVKINAEIQWFDDAECCECGSKDHTCEDCPVFGGPGTTPGFPEVSGLRFVEVDGVRFVEQETKP